ncbi:MAG: YceI family protein [Microscillaceae bacterium]|jgi:polyisoprenoid-binding protein YceI|nr:YceI family protein [Microscillaceae bacterium]
MRKLNVLFFVGILAVASAFTMFVVKESWKVSVADSQVEWYAKKVTGAHNGTVTLKSGSLEVAGGKLSGGQFVIDMTTIKVTDIEEGSKSNKSLLGHLKSADFFDVEKHTTAELKIKSVAKTGKQATSDAAKEYTVKADLTIKGITNPIEFTAYANIKDGKADARATIIFDRSKYDVRYGSETFFGSLGDKAIYNDVEMKIKLKAGK